MERIENLDELLNSDDTNNIIIEIDSFISELCEYGDNLNLLTEPQKNIYFNQCLEREVNNGGFHQYFLNSGNIAHETINSLHVIGAKATADILQKAIDEFPNKRIPQDWDERLDILEQIEETAGEVWGELDDKFFEYADDLNALNIEYIKRNQDKF